jgi:4-hydroxy-tetrahydrodipicolinate reductase
MTRGITLLGHEVQSGYDDATEARMTDLPGVVVTGAAGRMGQVLLRLIDESPDLRLTGAIVLDDEPIKGREAAPGVVYESDPLEAFARSRVVIDFSSPAATCEFAALAAQNTMVHVIGTTGLSGADLAKIEAASYHATIIRAGNMSLGVNLLTRLTTLVAKALDADFDIEVIEAHHNRKVDAPSGTALMLGEAAAKGRGIDLSEFADRARDGMTGARQKGHIGFSSIRAGDIIGEHDVIFAGGGERIILRHVATDRALFARGALKAALWGLDQKPGEYDMMDVLGLK